MRKIIQKLLAVMFLAMSLSTAFVLSAPKSAYAACGCTGCLPGDCDLAAQIISDFHNGGPAACAGGHCEGGEDTIMRYISDRFVFHREWYVETFFKEHILAALQLMTEQMSAVAMQQVFMIGSFLDAKNQLETQRLIQELHAQAHKDYQPSEDFCWFGTNARSLAASEQNAKFNIAALSARQLGRHLGNANTIGAESRDQDKANRWRQFTEKYCDPHDNNWLDITPGTGLEAVCTGSGNTERVNADIDFTRVIDSARTLEVNYTHIQPRTTDEEDVLALGNNLYGSDLLAGIDAENLKNKQYQHLYLALRSVAAKRSVAENTYNAIVGMKSSGSSRLNGAAPRTREFLASVIKELGVPDEDIYKLIGEDPSYYAQLEILAKRIYQNPDFFANLYDTPANVQRKSVALKAIESMLDRAIYESQLRQEMATSVLLSSKLRPQFRDVNRQLSGSGGR